MNNITGAELISPCRRDVKSWAAGLAGAGDVIFEHFDTCTNTALLHMSSLLVVHIHFNLFVSNVRLYNGG